MFAFIAGLVFMWTVCRVTNGWAEMALQALVFSLLLAHYYLYRKRVDETEALKAELLYGKRP